MEKTEFLYRVSSTDHIYHRAAKRRNKKRKVKGYYLVICRVSSTDHIYHRAAKRRGDKFDRSMTLGKLLDNNPTLFIFYFYSNDDPRD